MDANERYQLIQRYLDGTLTAEELRAVEARMSVDVDFRVEVELQRRSRQTLPNLDVRGPEINPLLPDEVPAPRPAFYNYDYSRLVIGFGFALLVFWMILELAPSVAIFLPRPSAYAPRRAEPLVTTPETIVVIPHRRADEAYDTAYEGIVAEPMPPATRPGAPFAPNETFEQLRGYRGPAGDTIIVRSPDPSQHFDLIDGRVEIEFSGSVAATADTVVFPVVIQLFDNQPVGGEPQLQFSPDIVDRSGPWTFATTRRLRMPPGLYYFRVRRLVGAPASYVGKFTVGE